MNNVVSSDFPGGVGPVSAPSRDLVSTGQIHTVLHILSSLQPYLLLTEREYDGLPAKLDGGVACAAVATFAAACGRLDSMLADGSRWSLAAHDELHKAVIEHFVAAKKVNEAQCIAVEAIKRPSRSLQPRVTVSNGLYIAFWGDPTLPGGMILGKGATPAEAIADFDAAFTRSIADQIKFGTAAIEKLSAAQAQKEQSKPGPEAPRKHKRKN